MKNTMLSILKIFLLVIIYIVIAFLTAALVFYLDQLLQKNVVLCPDTNSNSLSLNYDSSNNYLIDIIPGPMFECYSILGITITADNSNTLFIIYAIISLLIVPAPTIYFIAKKLFKKKK